MVVVVGVEIVVIVKWVVVVVVDNFSLLVVVVREDLGTVKMRREEWGFKGGR